MDSLWSQTHRNALIPSASIDIANDQHVRPQTQPSPQTQPQPQPQLHAIFPLGSKQSEARKYTAKDWEELRSEITRLYENNALKTVIELMTEQHGLSATPKQYKDRIKKWGLNKNVQSHEMKAIIRKQQKRQSESNKRTAFRVRKRPIPQGRIDRYIMENSIIPHYDANIDVNMGSAATPGGISYYTPSDTGPLTPDAGPSPLAASNPRSSTAHRSPHSGSYQFGDPGPTLPASPWAAQMTSSFHRPTLSPAPVATSPIPFISSLIELDESIFTGQSPAPFPAPSDPQLYDHDVLQDGEMEIMPDGGNSDIPASIYRLACKFEKQGKFEKAEQMHRRALELNQNALGSEHPDTLTSMNDIACILKERGRYRAAEQLHQQTLDLRQKVLGPKHPDTLSSMSGLACVFEEQGKYIIAKKLYQQTLDLREKVLGTKDPNTLASMNDIGRVLWRQGRYREAERVNRQTLQLRQQVLGPEHLDTLVSISNLSIALSWQGKYIEAEEIDRQTLQLRQKVLGPEHPETLMSMGNLATVLSKQGKKIEAEQIRRQMLQLSQKVLGPEHPETLLCMDDLAAVLSSQGKNIEAEQIHRQTLQLKQKVLGPEHLETLMSMGNLVVVLRRQGKNIEVEQIDRQMLQLKQKVFGPENPDRSY